MPSVSAKLSKQPSLETSEPLKQVQILVEKKIRNLEKRKVSLMLIYYLLDFDLKLRKHVLRLLYVLFSKIALYLNF